MSRRSDFAAELLDEARGLSGDFDVLSQTVAVRAGLSGTEMLAIDLIGRGPEITAGQLARDLNLTTGAITGLVDRLERAGYARRKADPVDRRRVFITSTAKERRVRELYGPLRLALCRAVAGYSAEELATLIDFLRKLRS